MTSITMAGLLVCGATDNTEPATASINKFGIKLFQSAVADFSANICISPYSIQSALAMTYMGADGETFREMSQVLGFPEDTSLLAASFRALNASLLQSTTGTENQISLNIANRLFGRTGFAFKKTFLNLLQDNFQAPLEELDFEKNPTAAENKINAWVANHTENRILNLIPPGTLDKTTKLVLANALYFKAPWAMEFPKSATQQLPFLIFGHKKQEVPTMIRTDQFGYGKDNGLIMVSIPCRSGDFQFIVLLPDAATKTLTFLTPDLLARCAHLPRRKIKLFLPKFKLEPPTLSLGNNLQTMGLKTAFDVPRGSADFNHMASRDPQNYIYISDVFHKTFVALDEKGIEAAAATAVIIPAGAHMMPKSDPVEVHVDRPFYFVLQHIPTGTCLFLGCVVDPRSGG